MDSADIFAVHLNHDTEELRHGLHTQAKECAMMPTCLPGRLEKAGMVRRL